MNTSRGRYWWVWPDFTSEKDARDGSYMGVVAAAWIALSTAGLSFYRYYANVNSDSSDLFGGLIFALVWFVLGYGIFRMSRIAATIGLIIYVGDRGYYVLSSAMSGGHSSNIALGVFFFLYLLNANRAIYWHHQKREPKEAPAVILNCAKCGTPYNLSDYQPDAETWYCRACGGSLPKP